MVGIVAVRFGAHRLQTTADRGEQPFSIDSLWSSSLCHLLFGFVTESETCLYAT